MINNINAKYATIGRPAGGSAPQDKLVHIVGSGSGGSNRVTMLASEVARIRQAGATQLSRLLRPLAKGGGGFALALASNGKLFAREERLHEFLLRMGSNGYWDQLDMWFARNGTTRFILLALFSRMIIAAEPGTCE